MIMNIYAILIFVLSFVLFSTLTILLVFETAEYVRSRMEDRKMANAMKCDRCGQYYDENKQHKTTGRISGSKITGISLVCDLGSDTWIDLCDDCITDLKEFMKGK